MAIYFYRINTKRYFQAQKFVGHPSHQDEIRLAATLMEAAEKGRERHRPLRTDWNAIRDDAMRRALIAKFAAHPELTTLLIATGDETLVEKTINEYYWGCGTEGTGKNRLGEILMETREGYTTK